MQESLFARIMIIVEAALEKAHRVGASRVDEGEFAKRILTAIREPTDAMLIDAIECDAAEGRPTSGHVWRAMIDRALAEVPLDLP